MGSIPLSTTVSNSEAFRRMLKSEYGVDVSLCYQCGKCSAGCPAAFAMDRTVRQVVRLVQLGMLDDALRCNGIWDCVSCETCSTRCPRGVEPARVMEAMRIEAKKAGVLSDRNTDLFNDMFLKTVEQNGRLFEFGLMAKYNISTGQFFKDADLAPKMLSAGKLKLSADKVKNPSEIAKIFRNVQKRGGK